MLCSTLETLSPLLNQLDLRESTEGYLDPLSLYAIADSLGVRLAPGVRERQSHPRYLTAMAVAAAVCASFDEDTVASDGVSPPWQVFEWLMVEGLVRTQSEDKPLVGLPGRDKVGRTLKDKVPVSARTYLKTPSVFGFHGVYRLLAKTLDVVNEDRLGELGYRLLSAWEKAQGLPGFYTTNSGVGQSVRQMLQTAVQEGLAAGHVTRYPGWRGWEFFNTHLHPNDFTHEEAQLIAIALLDEVTPYREQTLRFLTSREGQKAWVGRDEREFHQKLRPHATPDFTALLDAIDHYETFSRMLQDAFDDCLYHLSQYRHPQDFKQLGDLPSIKACSQAIPKLYRTVSDALSPFNESSRFETTFRRFADPLPPAEWAETLLDHHREVQNNKPPNGRAPWLDWFANGKVMVRAGYVREEGGRHTADYVHAYRTMPLYSFAMDLGMLSS